MGCDVADVDRKRWSCPQCSKVYAIPAAAKPPTICPKCKSESAAKAPPPLPEQQLEDPLVHVTKEAARGALSIAGSIASATAGLTKSAAKSAASMASTATTAMTKRSESVHAPATTTGPAILQVPGFLDRLVGDGQARDVIEKVLSSVASILMQDERIEYVAVQQKPVMNWFPDCVVATDQRFILYRPKTFGRVDFEDYQWLHLGDVKIVDGMLGSTLTFVVTNGKTLALDYIPKPQARKLYGFAQSKERDAFEIRRQRNMEESRAAAGGVTVQTAITAPAPVIQQAASPVVDPMQKLEKLKSMLSAELITQAEFDAKKAEILAAM